VSAASKRVAVVPLVACILALVICPYLYIAIGTLFRFPPPITYLLLPFFLLGSAFLLWRYLSRPRDRLLRWRVLNAAEAASWVVLLAFLFFISDINLMPTNERVGFAGALFLASWAVCLPLAVIRKTDLERRLINLPNAVALAAAALILVLVGIDTISYVVTPQAGIGRSTRHRRGQSASPPQ
jgi:hypothetical protein